MEDWEKQKFLGWVCPECLEINEVIRKEYQEFNIYEEDNRFNEKFVECVAGDLVWISFLDCGCQTEKYITEELEVWINEEEKILYGNFISELDEDRKEEFLKKNDLEGYKIIENKWVKKEG